MRDHWERTADQYEAQGDAFTRQYAEAAWDLAQLAHGAEILDIATGVGALLLPALRAGALAHAIDFSSAMVARTKERAELIVPGAGARVRQMDGQALEYPDASFDAAFSIFGIMLFPDPDAGLREMARVLRPGGLAVMAAWESTTGAGPALLFQQAVAELFPDAEFGTPLGNRPLFNTKALMHSGLARAGLQPQSMHAVTRDWELPAPSWPRENAQLAFGWSPAWQALSEADRARVVQAVEARIEMGQKIAATAMIGLATKPA